MSEFETTLTNSEAFEKWYKQHDTLSEYSARVAWQAGTAEADKRIAELNSENKQIDAINASLQAHINVLREALESAKQVYTTSKDAQVKKGYAESGAIKHYTIEAHTLHKALSATPAQHINDDMLIFDKKSLQAHDNEVIERVVTLLKDSAWDDGIIDMRVNDLIEDVRKLKGTA